MQWHQLDHMQTICTLLQTDKNINTSSLNFYMQNALPGTPKRVKNAEGKNTQQGQYVQYFTELNQT